MIFTSISRILMAFSLCFAQFSTLMKSAPDVLAQKNFPIDTFNSKILDTIKLISNWTSCRTIYNGDIIALSGVQFGLKSYE